jgi:hypothetical protein
VNTLSDTTTLSELPLSRRSLPDSSENAAQLEAKVQAQLDAQLDAQEQDTASTLAQQLRRAHEILDTLPSIRYVVLDDQGRPQSIEAQWPSLYDYYLEQYNIETPLSLEVLKQQLEQAQGNVQALRLLNVQLIETLTYLTAALDEAQQAQSSFWSRLFRSDSNYNAKNANLTYSTAIAALSVLCNDSEETLAALQPATCQLKFQ